MQKSSTLFYRYSISNALTTLLLTLLAGACGQTAQDDIVAIVGEEEIDAEELRTFSINLLPGLRSNKKGQEARLDYLQTLIDRELLLLEARDQKLDLDAQFLDKYETKKRNHILGIYQQREILSKVQATEEEIRRYFVEHGWERERQLNVILVHTEEEAWQIRAQLEEGADFAELARRHSIDDRAARQGGDLGFLSRPMTEQLIGIPPAVFDTLRTNEISPPLPHSKAYHLVRFVAERKGDVREYWDRVKGRLLKEKHQLAEAKQIELLAYELNWHLAPEGLELLKRQGASLGERRALDLSEVEKQTPLFVYEGGGVTASQYIDMLRKRHIKTTRALDDSAFIVSLGRRFLRKTAVLGRAAADLDLPTDPEIVAWAEELERELLLQTVRQRAVVEKVDIDEAELRRFYKENKEKYLTYETVCFDEILVPSQKVALQIREEISADVNLLALARQKNLKARRRDADSLICMPSPHKQTFPELWQALVQAPIGELGGPVYTRSGYALFRKVRHLPSRQETFEEAEKKVRASLKLRLEGERFERWMEELRQKYEKRVTVYADRLAAALPEALLVSASEERQN